MLSLMKHRWVGISGAILILAALVLGAAGPRLFPTAFRSAAATSNHPMMAGTMPNGMMMGGMADGAMPNGMMMGGMMNGMMSGEVGGDASLPFDQRFLDQMIMHHEAAVMSTQMMIAGSARPELRDLAQRIIAGQQAEIDQMREWRAAWYGSAGAPPAHAAMMAQMGGNGMGGGQMAQMMGGDRDAMYLQMMIPHHQAAIAMSRQALTQAEHPELVGLAERIIATQQAEIAEMQGYLDK